jgi:hypothetical protein
MTINAGALTKDEYDVLVVCLRFCMPGGRENTEFLVQNQDKIKDMLNSLQQNKPK